MPEIPASFRALVAERPEWGPWADRLPRLLRDLLDEWELRVDGDAMSGQCAVVVPVIAEGQPAALKVGWPHWEAETEHLALRAWDGDGAVRLLRADPHRHALLLERLDGSRDLRTPPVLEATEILAGFYARLHRPALPQTRRLSELCRDWHARMPPLVQAGLLPRRLTTQVSSLLAAFADEPGLDDTLIHTDLHYLNVLAAEREPWLVIDPKPLAGDPAYEVAPVLWNRWDEALASGNVRQATLAKLFTVVDVAGLDEDRVRDWVVVRVIVNVLWEYEDSLRGAKLDPDSVTGSTTIAKAVQR